MINSVTEPIGIFSMVISYLAMNFVGLLIWQYFVLQLIGLRFRDVLSDILPYLGITLGSFLVAWLLTKNVVNLYALFVAKISISAVLYVLVLKWSNAVIFKESMAFLLKKQKNEERGGSSSEPGRAKCEAGASLLATT